MDNSFKITLQIEKLIIPLIFFVKAIIMDGWIIIFFLLMEKLSFFTLS